MHFNLYLDIPLISIFSSTWLPCTEKGIYMISFSEWFRNFWYGGKKNLMLVQNLTVLLKKVKSFAYTISDPQFLHRKYTTLSNCKGQGRGKRLNEGKKHGWTDPKRQPTNRINPAQRLRFFTLIPSVTQGPFIQKFFIHAIYLYRNATAKVEDNFSCSW